MKSGIYMITCNESKKVYIGSSRNMKSRYQVHLSDLKRGKHGNPYMVNVFKKYGKEAFNFSVLEYCGNEFLLDREYFWIDHYQSIDKDKGFNIIYDCKREKEKSEKCNSNEYRKKIGLISKNRWKDPEFAKKNIEAIQKAHKERANRGETLGCLSEEGKRKSRESCSTPEFFQGLSERGKKQLEDPEQRKIALKTLEEGRSNPLRLENLRKSKQNPEYKKMIAEKTRLSWIKRREKREQ